MYLCTLSYRCGVQPLANHFDTWFVLGLQSCTFIYLYLLFIDPLAALFLFYRPRIGLALTFLIIFSDVIHNTWITLKFDLNLLNYMYVSQFSFLLFVLCTIRFPWTTHKIRTSIHLINKSKNENLNS